MSHPTFQAHSSNPLNAFTVHAAHPVDGLYTPYVLVPTVSPGCGMARLLVAALLLTACGGGTTKVTCDNACPPCASDEVCLPGNAVTSAACVHTCTTDIDCASGLVCAQLDLLGSQLPPSGTPRVCISSALPATCVVQTGAGCSDHGVSLCLDDQHLGTPFVWADSATCGYTVTTCSNGCETTMSESPRSGHCR